MTKTMLIFGCGYSGRALAKTLIAEGWRVIGTTRSADKARELAAEGIEAVIWPGSDMAPHLAEATHLLLSAAPDDDGDPVLAALRDEIAAERFDWVGYLSTTGVYGDHQGGWVDEATTLTPSTRRGHQRVRAEGQWQALAAEAGLPLHIFRLAGIYGPGRGPFAKVRRGTARQIVKPGQVFSRIHVEDIAQVLAASIARPDPGAVYNVCDDLAAPPEDVLAFAAELLGVTLPPAEDYEAAEMTPMARSFYAESKRVHNDRIKVDLRVVLVYPTYRDGLSALFALVHAKE
jgi:nucleoside-diphosphate-sugar epimerase